MQKALHSGIVSCLILATVCTIPPAKITAQIAFLEKTPSLSNLQANALSKNAEITPSANSSQLIAQQTNCGNARSQAEINQCTQRQAQAADKKLNETYQQLMKKLSASQKQNLVQAQTAWIQFRDATCAYEKSRFEGGSIAPTVYNNCIERLTKQRTVDFQNYLKPGWPMCDGSC